MLPTPTGTFSKHWPWKVATKAQSPFFVIANRNSSGKYQTVEENGKLSRLKRQSVHKTVHFNLMKLMSCRIKCGQTEEMWMLKKNIVHAYRCVHLYTCVCMRVCACMQMCVSAYINACACMSMKLADWPWMLQSSADPLIPREDKKINLLHNEKHLNTCNRQENKFVAQWKTSKYI